MPSNELVVEQAPCIEAEVALTFAFKSIGQVVAQTMPIASEVTKSCVPSVLSLLDLYLSIFPTQLRR